MYRSACLFALLVIGLSSSAYGQEEQTLQQCQERVDSYFELVQLLEKRLAMVEKERDSLKYTNSLYREAYRLQEENERKLR